jgi:DNA-binding NarL/FixJ family response regulator
MTTGVRLNEGRMGVAIVDDDEDTRLCFTDVIKYSETFKVSGSFSDASTAVSAIPRLQPHLVLMDFQMPGLNGFEATKRLMFLMPLLKVVMVTGNLGQGIVEAASKAGAVALLLKPTVAEQLIATLEFASHLTKTVPANLAKAHVSSFGKSRSQMSPGLSPREKEVLAGLAEGLLYKEVSEKLGISYSAVHKYQHSIFQKLHVSNRSEAIRLWFQMRGI